MLQERNLRVPEISKKVIECAYQTFAEQFPFFIEITPNPFSKLP
jgi:hypothetical protein